MRTETAYASSVTRERGVLEGGVGINGSSGLGLS